MPSNTLMTHFKMSIKNLCLSLLLSSQFMYFFLILQLWQNENLLNFCFIYLFFSLNLESRSTISKKKISLILIHILKKILLQIIWLKYRIKLNSCNILHINVISVIKNKSFNIKIYYAQQIYFNFYGKTQTYY